MRLWSDHAKNICMTSQINEGIKLRLTQRRPMEKFLVSLLPRYFDADEQAFIARIRDHGFTANTNAHGTGWYEGHGNFCETAWIDKRWKADSPFALERERIMAKELAEKRKRHAEEMQAARKHVEEEWRREQLQAKKLKAYAAVQAKERRERWEQENAFWLCEERKMAERKAARQAAEQAEAAADKQQQIQQRDQSGDAQWDGEVVYEYIGPPPPNTDWRLVMYYRRDLGHYTWDTLKNACRMAIVEQKREFMSQIMEFLNVPDVYYDGVLAACTELVSDGKLVRLR